jgi:hypothetical protein
LYNASVYRDESGYAAEPEAFGGDEVLLLTELANDLAYGVTTLRTRAERAAATAAHQ